MSARPDTAPNLSAREAALFALVTEAAIGTHPFPNLWPPESIVTVVSLDHHCHVVELVDPHSHESVWTTVHLGQDPDRTRYASLDLALLHLVARRTGTQSLDAVASAAGALGISEAR